MQEETAAPSSLTQAVREVLMLIERRYQDDGTISMDREIFVRGMAVLQQITCIWCQQSRISGELLRLLSFPPNECQRLFCEKTTASLSSCANCLEAYYDTRTTMATTFSNLYKPETLELFWVRVNEFDVRRIHEPLENYLEGRIDAKDSALLFSLYELLLHPAHLQAPILHANFSKVLLALVASRKMIRISRPLPGLFKCLFDKDLTISKWAESALTHPAMVGNFDFSLNLKELLTDFGGTSNQIPNLLLVVKWLPNSISDSDLNLLVMTLTKFLYQEDFTNDILTGLNSIFKRRGQQINYKTWTNFIDSLFEAPKFKNDLRTKQFDSVQVGWVEAFRQWSINNNQFPTLLKLVERLSLALAIMEGDVSAQNLSSLTATLMDGKDMVKLLAKNPFTQVYKLLAACVSRIKDINSVEASTINRIPNICWGLDRSILEEGSTKESSRGFADLLARIINIELFKNFAIDLVITDLASSKVDLVLFCQKRPSILKAVCENVTMEYFSKDNYRATILLFFYNSQLSNYISHVRKLLLSFPERFIMAYSELLSGLKVSMQAALRESLLLNAIRLYTETFSVAFYVDSDQSTTIVDLFPDSNLLLSTTISSALSLTLATIKKIPEILNKEGLVPDILKVLGFAGKLYLAKSDASRKALIENLKFTAEKVSVILETLSTCCINRGNLGEQSLVPTVILLIDLAQVWSLKFSPTALKIFAATLVSMKLTSQEKSTINLRIDEYEKRTKFVLPRPPADVIPKELPSLTPVNIMIDPNLEGQILEDIKAKAERKKEKAIEITLKSKSSLVVAAPKSCSKVEQLRAEVIKDAVLHPPLPKRRILPKQLNKPQRLDEGGSSASEIESENDYGTLGNHFAKPNMVDSEQATNRSVKLIDVADATLTQKASVKSTYAGMAAEASLTNQFHRAILNLDFGKEVKRTVDSEATGKIPDTFESAAHYISVFEPLLLIECRAQLLAAYKEANYADRQFLRISGVAHVDDFHEVTLQIMADGDDNSKARLTDQDYIIVYLKRYGELPAVIVRLGTRNGIFEATLRMSIPRGKASLQLELLEGSNLRILKAGSVITSLREYLALHMIGSALLAPTLFQPRLVPLTEVSEQKELAGVFNTIKINQSQARAILAVVQQINPITLIQGPPGTGKTKTIEALLGVLLGRANMLIGMGEKPRKILICAPSNAAIDEIVRRIRDGLVSGTGQKFMAKILRIGSSDMIAEAVKDLSLENQVEALLKASVGTSSQLLEKQKRTYNDLKQSLKEVDTNGNEARKKSLESALWETRDALRKNSRSIEETRQALRQRVLTDAQIICCTLSGSGHELLSRLEFEQVIIDEACQAVEVACLVPLQRYCRQLVLVGDPNQLPPTVISQMAGNFSYEQSLFVRLQRQCPKSVALLDTQYRMHPSISLFPNNYFYQGRLLNGLGMSQNNWRPWHADPTLAPFVFFDIPTGEEGRWHRGSSTEVESHSRMNELEARVAANIIAMLCERSPGLPMAGRIGIVTPYKDQQRCLRREIAFRFGHSVLSAIEISTVDGFQGQEREVIIFSCVRTGESQTSIGFLNDTRRLNVALTRAQCSLFVLGKAATLVQNPIWKAMIEDAQRRRCFITSTPRMWEEASRIRLLPNLVAPPPPSPSASVESKAEPIKNGTLIKTVAQRLVQNK